MRKIGAKYYTDGSDIFKYDQTPIPHDEPLILFRGRDRLVPQMLEYYLKLRQQITDPKQNLDYLKNDFETIADWQKANPGKVRTPR
jgi:hypothetical protein